MHKGFLKTGAILGAITVALGAFGAHSLKKLVSTQALEIFETGIRYQFLHVFAIIIVGILFKEFPNKLMIWAGRLFVVGILLFSGSLFFLTILKGFVIPGYAWVGPITPIGGLCFIVGWICLLFSFKTRH